MHHNEVVREKEYTLCDLLDRILTKGVVLYGDVTLSVADVDLVYLGLRLLLTSVERAEQMRKAAPLRLAAGMAAAVEAQTQQ